MVDAIAEFQKCLSHCNKWAPAATDVYGLAIPVEAFSNGRMDFRGFRKIICPFSDTSSVRIADPLNFAIVDRSESQRVIGSKQSKEDVLVPELYEIDSDRGRNLCIQLIGILRQVFTVCAEENQLAKFGRLRLGFEKRKHEQISTRRQFGKRLDPLIVTANQNRGLTTKRDSPLFPVSLWNPSGGTVVSFQAFSCTFAKSCFSSFGHSLMSLQFDRLANQAEQLQEICFGFVPLRGKRLEVYAVSQDTMFRCVQNQQFMLRAHR